MQIFLCWSGKASHAIALAMHTFLGDTIQEIKPFLSSEDIRKGGRWNNEIGARLAECNFGILCMTKENLDARWILFEAGALSKLPTSHVTAMLAGIQSTDVREPLSQFQHTTVTRDEVAKLLADINELLPVDKRLDAGRLERAFENNWPTLEKSVDDALKLKSPDPAVPSTRSTASLLTEVLELVRELKRETDTSKQGALSRGLLTQAALAQFRTGTLTNLSDPAGMGGSPVLYLTGSDQPSASTKPEMVQQPERTAPPAPIEPLKTAHQQRKRRKKRKK